MAVRVPPPRPSPSPLPPGGPAEAGPFPASAVGDEVRGDLFRLVDAFAGLRVVVVGEAMLDSYLCGSAGRLCREAPVPIVDVESRTDTPGGAANTAANVRSLGGQVVLVSVVGADHEGALLRRALLERGVPVDALLVSEDRRTLAKHRLVADGQVLTRFDQGTTAPVPGDLQERLIERLDRELDRADAVICSDYGYGILTPRVIEALRAAHRARPTLVVVDAKDLRPYRELGPTAVKPNYREAVRLLGEVAPPHAPDRLESAMRWGERLLDLTGSQVAALTLDTEGAVLFERGAPPHRTYTTPTRNSRAAGAGDTFAAALTLALAAGATTPAAGEVASAAAAVVVGKDGTSTCSGRELGALFARPAGKWVASTRELGEVADLLHREGRRVVFTNGCFDILHRGHIAYLNRAKSLGDVLVLGLNSDRSVRRLKGPERPINGLEDRAQVLAALSCIDHIVPFDGDTPVDLISALRPDVYVKGGDYTREMLAEAPLVESLGGRVEILPFVENRSTTGIIQRIRGAAG